MIVANFFKKSGIIESELAVKSFLQGDTLFNLIFINFLLPLYRVVLYLLKIPTLLLHQ